MTPGKHIPIHKHQDANSGGRLQPPASTGGSSSTTNIAGLPGISTELAAHLADTSDAHDASAVSVTPSGSIAATDVQAAIEEIAAGLAGHYEVLMDGSGTATPLEDGSGADWLYVFVS